MGGTVTLTGSVTGLSVGAQSIGPLNVQSLTPVGEVLTVALVSGDSVVPVPAGATQWIVVPPPNNSAALKVRSVSGDTGVPIHPSLGFASGTFDPNNYPADLYINASAGVTGTAIVWFI